MGDEAVRVRSDQLVRLLERLERSGLESLIRTMMARWRYATVCWWALESREGGPWLQGEEDEVTVGSEPRPEPRAP